MDDAFSHTEVNSLHSVKILLCYLLNKLDMPVSPDDLLQIVMDSEIINYFYYNDAVCALLDNGALVLKRTLTVVMFMCLARRVLKVPNILRTMFRDFSVNAL